MKLSALLDVVVLICLWLAFFAFAGVLASAAKTMFCFGYGC